ncbi:FAD-dependent monooxygenase [Sorangium cellulosum]|uniref:FAD-dependent monooxygenase n=1 Tax=Sorangium cellulosum TaxID=56 RepID=UPI003D9A620E
MTTAPTRTILISGASIAGPVLAYWLHKYGFRVTVVEKAKAVRGGGYPIDLRGTAMDAAARMGLREQLMEANIRTRKLSFVDRNGKIVGSVRPESITGGVEGRDIEVPRGVLATMLAEITRDDVEYIFDDSIDSLADHGSGVDVTFKSGARRTFDLVAGADGLHSNVRRLVFGAESQFERYLGRYFVGFMTENRLKLSREGMCLNAPTGHAVVQYAVGDEPPMVHGFFIFSCAEPPPLGKRDLDAQRKLFEREFADVGWVAPQLLDSLRRDDTAFFDTVSQIHMPAWSKGRVVLVGDAGYAPSFLSGQGSSLAMVGAYVLAGELASNPDHRTAMASYERILRPFVAANQALAEGGRQTLAVESEWRLKLRNLTFQLVFPLLDKLKLGRFIGRKNRAATTAIRLPDYSALVSG